MLVVLILAFSCATSVVATNDETELLPADGYKQGDVNMDNHIDIKDVILVLRYAVGIIALTDKQAPLADINSNGEVTVIDALYIQKKIVNTQETPTEPTTNKFNKPIELPIIPAE